MTTWRCENGHTSNSIGQDKKTKPDICLKCGSTNIEEVKDWSITDRDYICDVCMKIIKKGEEYYYVPSYPVLPQITPGEDSHIHKGECSDIDMEVSSRMYKSVKCDGCGKEIHWGDKPIIIPKTVYVDLTFCSKECQEKWEKKSTIIKILLCVLLVIVVTVLVWPK